MTTPSDSVGSVACRGSVFTWSALALFAIVLSLAGASGGLVSTIKGGEHAYSAREELQRRGHELARELAPLLAEDRHAEARVQLLAAQAGPGSDGFSQWRIVADDGVVVATSAALDSDDVAGAMMMVSIPLAVAGKGAMSLELESPMTLPVWMTAHARLAMIAGGALSGLMAIVLMAGVRRRMRALVLIREALLSLAEGEPGSGALVVDGRLGDEAVAWNRLVDERETLRREALNDRARDSMHNRADRRGDLNQACDALWQGMLLVDEHLRIKYGNGAAAVFLRSKKEELGEAAVSAFITDPQVLEAVRSIATGEVRRRLTHEIHRPEDEGGGILRFNIRPVRREDAAAALIIIEDITQQRIADEARNAFVAQVTHELRTPLTNIRLYVEQAIEDGQDDPAMVAQALNIINQETRRLERIVGDMLSVSEIEAGSFKLRDGEVRLDGLFDELSADYRPQAEAKQITLTFHLPPKLPAIRGDRDKIVLALHNLVGNAIKYTPEGGVVDVRVEVDESRLLVEVVDTGIGISNEEEELIFDKFYRSRDKRIAEVTGTGLGLALAREVVRLHGGDISVRSQLDRGSTFTMNLPTRAAA